MNCDSKCAEVKLRLQGDKFCKDLFIFPITMAGTFGFSSQQLQISDNEFSMEWQVSAFDGGNHKSVMDSYLASNS